MTSFAQRVAQLTGIEIAILTSPHVLVRVQRSFSDRAAQTG